VDARPRHRRRRRRVLVVAPATGGRRRLGRLGAGRASRAADAVRAGHPSDARALPGSRSHVRSGAGLVRPGLEQIPAADPTGRVPADVASLGLNEGRSGPFPAALDAIAAATPTLNRYPARGSLELVTALAERHGVPAAEVIVAAGADALI